MNHHLGKVELLLGKIVKQLAWGEVKQWNNYDFDQLSQMILDKTKVQLSAITLKRVFGKIKYDSSPSIHTLNTLSQFVDYSDWRDFQLKIDNPQPKSQTTPTSTVQTVAPQKSRFKYVLGMLVGTVLVGLLMSGISFNNEKNILSEDYEFDYLKIGKGIPSSVVFQYDASKAPHNSTIEIQQNWDKERRELIQASDSIHTSIYHYPGFFEAKLVINDQTVQERDVFIPSNGWVTAIENKSTPIYVPLNQSENENEIGIEPEYLKEQGFHLQSETTWTNYNLVEKFEAFSDDFYFEANLKNAAVGGTNICQEIQTLLLFEGDVMIIPLAKLGCISDIRLYVPNTELNGKTENLSMFGTSTEEWTHLKIQSKQEELFIFINGQEVKKLPLEMKRKRLIGLRFRFEGTGWIKDVKLNDKVLSNG